MKSAVFAALVVLGACATQSADDDALESESTDRSAEARAPSTSTNRSAAPETSDVAVATIPSGFDGQLFCGEFGSESLPTLIAFDIASGAVEWRECPEQGSVPIAPQIMGRAGSATLLIDQDGHGAASIRAIDENGVSRWERPVRVGTSPAFTAGDVAVVAAADVEGIDASTGNVLWTHPVAEGTPIGTTDSLVVEVSGGPYAMSTDVAPGSGVSDATMRALDAATGDERWSHEVELVPVPAPSQQSPSVVGSTVVIPHTDRTTDVHDVETGELLRNEALPEFTFPSGSVLVAVVPPGNTPSEIIEPRSGSRYTPRQGQIVYTFGQQHLPAGAGILMSSDPPVGPQAELWLLDETTGAERWSIPFEPVLGRSAQHLVVIDGPAVRVLSTNDGEQVSQFELPTDRAQLTGAAVGADQIVLSIASFGGPQEEPAAPPQVDCAAGTTLLDTMIADEAVTVVEVSDGQSLCIGGMAVGRMPTVPTAEPVFDQMGQFGDNHAWYTIAVPDGFADEVTVVDELGGELITARGDAADYLVVLQPQVGQSDGFPAMTEKRVDLVDGDGEVIARLAFMGFATEDVAPIEEVTFEDFVACVNENGVTMELPTPSSPPPTEATATPAQLNAAWNGCRDVWVGAQRYQDQGNNPQFVEQRLFLDDCLAEAGFYTMMGQPIDPGSYEVAYYACSNQSPGLVALFECLEQAGLEPSSDGTVRGGPYPAELSSAAWQECRPIAVAWLYPPGWSVPEFLAAFDCAAEAGWIIPLIGESPNFSALPSDVRSACVDLP